MDRRALRRILRAAGRKGGLAKAARLREERAQAADEANALASYFRQPTVFLERLIDPETKQPFVLYLAQRQFLEAAFSGPEIPPELIFGAIKKSGKTTLAGAIVLYVVLVLAGPFGEAYCVANDFDQSVGRVFRAIARIVKANPWLGTARILKNVIEFPRRGAMITALASDYASAAGANPHIVVFDELWAYTSERSRRLWDELVPVPTRRPSIRLTVSYAGFEGESTLLLELHGKGLQGERIAPALYRQPGLLMAWHDGPIAPWQTPEWVAQMRAQLRPNAYRRMIENRFVSSESGFVDLAWWDRCTSSEFRPVVVARDLPIWVGVDASVKRDSTAVVAVTWNAAAEKVRLVWHRILRPSPEEPIDFERDVHQTIRTLGQRFSVQRVFFDPYQMQASAQQLERDGVPMEEYPQTVDRLTAIGSNLYELIKGGNVEAYPDAELRSAMGAAVAKETPRGWRIAKEKTSATIDLVVALAMAALGATEGQVLPGWGWWEYVRREAAARRADSVIGVGGEGEGPRTVCTDLGAAPPPLPPVPPPIACVGCGSAGCLERRGAPTAEGTTWYACRVCANLSLYG